MWWLIILIILLIIIIISKMVYGSQKSQFNQKKVHWKIPLIQEKYTSSNIHGFDSVGVRRGFIVPNFPLGFKVYLCQGEKRRKKNYDK